MSEALPAVAPEMSLMGRLGKLWASAGRAPVNVMSDSSETKAVRRKARLQMGLVNGLSMTFPMKVLMNQIRGSPSCWAIQSAVRLR